MSKEDNIYDLVERAAAQRKVPRLELWQKTARALVDGELSSLNLFEVLQPRTSPTLTLAIWLRGFGAAMDRGNDPGRLAHILKHIIVRKADFQRWLGKANKSARGPEYGTTGYRTSDRKAFRRISQLIKDGKARGAYGAALQLADELAGDGTPESKAKRAATLYRREVVHSTETS